MKWGTRLGGPLLLPYFQLYGEIQFQVVNLLGLQKQLNECNTAGSVTDIPLKGRLDA